MNFTERELANWKSYERVRNGGRFNMFDPRARRETGLGPDAYSYVMDHYSELREAAEAQTKSTTP